LTSQNQGRFRTNLHLMTVVEDMFEFDFYRDVLIEHAGGRHVVKNAWFILIAIAVFITASALIARSLDAGVGPLACRGGFGNIAAVGCG
jgi:hypothetical protein